MAVSLPSAPVYAGQPADSKGDVTESETESEAASEQEENEDMEVSIVATVLLAILLIVYFAKPQKGQKRILDQLEKISFDNNYHRKVSKKAKADVKKKRTMREKAMVNVE